MDESKELRAAELDLLAAHFAAGARSVLVTGPAGVGKSTLLAAVAAIEAVAVRSLRGCATAEEVARRIAQDLPLPAEAVTATGAVDPALLASAVAARPAHVFVLDDAEGLDADARAFLATVLAAAPAQRAVVASRIAPRLDGEHVVRLEPLAEDDAVALLVAGARRSAPDYAPDAAEEEALRGLARDLDGLPLALVLAAPRLPLLGATELARTLRAGAPGLAAEIEASIATLRASERALVEKLAFAEGFDLALVEKLGGTAAELEAIHACSLLSVTRASGRVRYALYESVREVVTSALVARGDGARVAVAYRAALADRAGTLAVAVREGSPTAYGELSALAESVIEAATGALAEGENDTAVTATLALDVVPAVAPRVVALVDRLLDAKVTPAQRAALLVARARARFQGGDLARGRSDVDAALVDAQGAPPFWVALAASKAALVRVQAGEESGELFARAERAASSSSDRWLRATLLRDRALAEMRSGRDAEARRLLEEALELEPYGDELGALVRGVLGQLHQHAGELDAALARFREAGAMAARSESHTLAAWAFATGGAVEMELGRFAEARSDLDSALRIATEQRAPSFVAVSVVMLAQLAHESGDPARATVLYQRAIPALLRVKQQRGAALALAACAAAEGALGRPDAARGLLAEARRELTSARPGDEVALDAFELAALGVDPAKATSIEERARAVPSSDELRFALRRMRVAPKSVPPPPPSAPAAALRVPADGAWFETEAGRVHLPERSPLRRVLAALLARRIEEPGATLTARQVFASAWPDERVLPSALANRVKVAVSTLRRTGLRPFLETAGSGYRLAAEAAIVVDARD